MTLEEYLEKSKGPRRYGEPRKSELRQIAEIFRRHGVEFIVIDGQAETLMGSPRVNPSAITPR